MNGKSALLIAAAILIIGFAYIVFVGRPMVLAEECRMELQGVEQVYAECIEAGGASAWREIRDQRRSGSYPTGR